MSCFIKRIFLSSKVASYLKLKTGGSMFQWFFVWRYKRKLFKQLKAVDFKMKQASAELKSSALLEIDNSAKKLFTRLGDIESRLLARLKKIDVVLNYTDDFGIVNKRNYPPFKENEIQAMKTNNIVYKFILILFLASEMSLYYLTAEVIAPGIEAFKIVVAVVLAFFTMLLINFSMTNHFLYSEAKKRKEELKLKEQDLKEYALKRNIGYLMLFLAFAIIIASGFLRMIYIHTLDLSTYTEAERQVIKNMNFWVTNLTFAFTIGLAIFLAFMKTMNSRNKNNFKVYKKNLENDSKIKTHKKNFGEIKRTFDDILNKVTEKHWQLLFEFKKMFRLEYDPKFEELKKEYNTFREFGNELTQKDYIKFEDIQSCDEKLFKFGILSNDKIKAYSDKFASVQAVIDEIDEKFDSYKKLA